jgi:hypothetical protein
MIPALNIFKMVFTVSYVPSAYGVEQFEGKGELEACIS